MPSLVVVTAAVEGPVDEAILKRVCLAAGTTIGPVYGKHGKAFILARVRGYNHSAQFRHWVVLVDLNGDGACAPEVLPRWLPTPSRLMRFRVAVKEVEAWLMADPERLGGFLGLRPTEVPTNPDFVADPKLRMVELARRSRRRAIREDMVPSPRSGQAVGPAYTSRMIEFAQDTQSGWRPEVAARNSDSLRRCVAAVSNLARQGFHLG